MAASRGRVVVVERSEEQVYLVALALDGVPISDSLPVYPIPSGLLVPLGEICRLLQFAVDVDAPNGRAQGWFIDAKRTFAFDALTGKATVGGKDHSVDPRRFEVQAQDIFIEASLLSEWFPLALKVDLRASTLEIQAKERLPIQAKWARDQKVRRDQGISDTALEAERQKYVPMNEPYRIAEVPMLDETLRLGLTSQGSQRVAESTTLTTGDLLGMEHQAYFGLRNNGNRHHDFRVTLGRRDPDATLLGPLHATQFQMGDVMGQGLDLVLGGSTGTGILVSNHPLQLDQKFDRRSFHGNLPPGWQVELYHNTVLLGIRDVRPDGTYEFLDVPMHFGANEYRLILYGPQGQRREETYRSDINSLQVPEHAFRYRLYAQKPSQGARRGLAEAEYGITKGLSVGLATAALRHSTQGTEERHEYTALMVRSYFDRLASQLTVARMENGKAASTLVLQSGYGYSTISLRQSQFAEGYTSDTLQGSTSLGTLRRSTELILNLLGAGKGPFNAITTGLGARRDTYAGGHQLDTFYNRLNTNWLGLSLSNDLNWSREHVAEGQPSNGSGVGTTGTFSASKFMRGWGVRGSVTYTVTGKREITQYMASTNTRIAKDGWLNLNFTRDARNGNTSSLLSYQQALGKLNLGAELSHNRQTGWQAGLTLRSTFSREPRQGRWAATSTATLGNGAATALAFVDLNGNGVRDEGEPVKSGVGFLVNGFPSKVHTNDQGIALLQDVAQGAYAYVKVDNSSFEDPLWRSTHPGFRFVSRRGHATRIELPVTAASEVDGTVYTRVNGKRGEVSGVLVELLDVHGKSVAQIRSAFDGYFVFQNLPAGTYTLRVHPEDAAKRRVVPGAFRTLVLQPSGSILDGQDLEVKLLPAPKPIPEAPELPEPGEPTASQQQNALPK